MDRLPRKPDLAEAWDKKAGMSNHAGFNEDFAQRDCARRCFSVYTLFPKAHEQRLRFRAPKRLAAAQCL
jgi:hypothetical protein